MKEVINIYDGRGILHLKGSPSDSFLFINKEPKIACFYASDGTIHRYLVGIEINKEILKENYQYENLVKKGIVLKDKSLSNQFSFLTKFLTNGEYSLNYLEISFEHKVVYGRRECYYGYGLLMELIATQSYLNQQVVDEYKEKISNGTRPIIVLLKLEDSLATFIIDGHHKLKAYQELKINPKALIISKLDYKTVEITKGVKDLKELGLNDSEIMDIYVDEKKSKIFENNYYSFYAENKRY